MIDPMTTTSPINDKGSQSGPFIQRACDNRAKAIKAPYEISLYLRTIILKDTKTQKTIKSPGFFIVVYIR